MFLSLYLQDCLPSEQGWKLLFAFQILLQLGKCFFSVWRNARINIFCGHLIKCTKSPHPATPVWHLYFLMFWGVPQKTMYTLLIIASTPKKGSTFTCLHASFNKTKNMLAEYMWPAMPPIFTTWLFNEKKKKDTYQSLLHSIYSLPNILAYCIET